MKKIISLFKCDYEGTRLVYNEVIPGAEWVIEGEGIATEKIDGTCCMIRNGLLYKRYDVKKGKQRPTNFESAQEPDPVTGHWPGWIPVGNGPEDKWHREAFIEVKWPDGTYELIGPKVQGNPYRKTEHALLKHGAIVISPEPPRDFDGLKAWLAEHKIEGIVWHHADGRMVKIKRRNFGLSWPIF